MHFEELSERYRGRRAKDYDSERASSTSWLCEHNAVDAFLSEIPEGGTVLDIPLGTGRFIELYAKHGLKPTGIDISTDMLAQAAGKAKDLGLEIELREGDIRAIAARDESFDAAVCIRFLNWVDFEGLKSAITELTRVSNTLIVGLSCYLPPNARIDGFSLWQRLRGYKRRLKRRIQGQQLGDFHAEGF